MLADMSTHESQSPYHSLLPTASVGVSEAAKLCSVHRKTILRWIAKGHLVAEALTPTSPYRIRRQDLEIFLTNARLDRMQRPSRRDLADPL